MYRQNCGTVIIHGGTVNASGYSNENYGGAGIGGSGCSGSNHYGGSGGTITIYNGNVTATGGGSYYGSAGIGGGGGGEKALQYGGAAGTITIYGGIVTATGRGESPGIGAGMNYEDDTGTVTFYGGIVTAIGGSGYDSISGVEVIYIDGLYFEAVSNQTSYRGYLRGTNYTLTKDYTTPIGKLTIEAGQNLIIGEGVTLTLNCSLINNGTITNNGTLIITTSADKVSGSGTFAGEGEFIITGIAADNIHVPEDLVYTGEDQTDAAKSAIGLDETVTISGKEFTCDPDGWTMAGISPNQVLNAGDYTVTYTHATKGSLTKTFRVAKQQLDVSGMSWSVPANAVYNGQVKSANLEGTLPEGVTVATSGDNATNAGDYTAKATFSLAEGYSSDNYEIVRNGSVVSELTADWSIAPMRVTCPYIVFDPLYKDYVYNGEAKTPGVAIHISIATGLVTIPAEEYTVSYSNNTNAGTATVTITDNAGGNYTVSGSATFEITQSGTVFDGAARADKSAYVYGETITVTAKPEATGESPVTFARKAPAPKQMALYIGDKQISEAVDADENGVYTMTCDTANKDLAIGLNTITAKFVGDANMADHAQDITVKLNPKPLSAEAEAKDREYDRTTVVEITAVTLHGVIPGDDVSVYTDGLTADVASAEAGAYETVVFTDGLLLVGNHAGYYTVGDEAPLTAAVTITAANDWWYLLMMLYSQNFTVSAAATDGGTITPAGISQVKYDKSVTYRITPADGYVLADVLVDGESVGAVTAYTFANVKADHTISAVFAKAAWENPFSDVTADDWFYEDVRFVTEAGLMNGTVENETFAPDLTLTRAMLVTVLWRLEGSPAADSAAVFTDVPADEWYTAAVAWASANGIVLGFDDGRFYPEEPITREQLAAILHRYAVHKELDDGALSPTVPQYTCSQWAENDVIWADRNGLFAGLAVDVTDMTADATRAEVAALLHRFCEKFLAE